MLRTRQLPMTGAMHVGDPPTIHHMLAGSLEDRSPQVRAAIDCLSSDNAHDLGLILFIHQLGEAIIRALTALWRQAPPGTADIKTRAGRHSLNSCQASHYRRYMRGVVDAAAPPLGHTEGNAWLWTRLSDRSPSMRLATVDL